MDITRHNYQQKLAPILKAMAESRFIAFDLEMSGISKKQHRLGRRERQTLQDRYVEGKIAAETYQVVELGICVVEENALHGSYILRSYNIPISPLTNEKLFDRDFTIQSSALSFLFGHGFQLQSVLTEGVPYLSRAEESDVVLDFQARKKAREQTRTRDGIRLDGNDPSRADDLRFLSRVRREVMAWACQTPHGEYLDILPTGYGTVHYDGYGLNSFQRRLVHELIQDEHPDLRSISQRHLIRIVWRDPQREAIREQEEQDEFNEIMNRQIGCRWLVEAMCPNVDDALLSEHEASTDGDLNCVAHWADPPINLIPSEIAESRKQFSTIVKDLKEKPKMLVGHNMLLDLIFFVSCFLGPLPDDILDFLSMVKKLFPVLIDTKDLAHAFHDDSPSYRKSSLEELDDELSHLEVPLIEVAPGFEKYVHVRKPHEAGFDAEVTARNLIRLAAHMDISNQTKRTTPKLLSPPDPQPTNHNPVIKTSENHSTNKNTHSSAGPSRSYGIGAANANPFGALDHLTISEDEEQQWYEETEDVRVMIPAVDSDFWTRYGNRIRVNGTVEGRCSTR